MVSRRFVHQIFQFTQNRSLESMTHRIGDNLVHFHANGHLVEALVDAGVDFIVIGGLAISWHCPSRTADDLDLLTSPSTENAARLGSALTYLGLRNADCANLARPGLQIALKHLYYAEILTPTIEGPSFDEISQDAVRANLLGIPVRVASIRCLIRMKEISASPGNDQEDKHIKDLALLRRQLTSAT